jgi:ribonuclease HI
MTPPSFTCERCGAAFELSDVTLARYPGWTPRHCNRCRTPSSPRAAIRGNSGRSSRPPASSPSTRSETARTSRLTTVQVLERYSRGPDTGVFTDGSCSGNPGPGGWGAVRVEAGRIISERYGSDPQTTNNRMELTAMIAGLGMVGPDEAVDVYSDSNLVVQTLTQWAAGWARRGWRRSTGEVKNVDLVKEAYALALARPHARIQWIRAHDGSRWNEYADALSTAYLRSTV